MVEKSVRKRQLTPAEWAGLEQMRLSGMTLADIAERSGLTKNWVCRKLTVMAADPVDIKRARQHGALSAEMARIIAALPDDKPADVERRAKAISAVVKASRELEGMMADDDVKADNLDDDEPSLEDLRAELERRFAILDEEVDTKRPD